MVRDENLKFMKNRDVYSSDYFSFVLSLASLNAVSNQTSVLSRKGHRRHLGPNQAKWKEVLT